LTVATPQENSLNGKSVESRTRVNAQFESLRRAAVSGDSVLHHKGLEVRWAPLSQFQLDSSAWRDLVKRAMEPNVFLEPSFAFAAAERFGDRDLGVLSVHAGSQLVAFLPGRVEGISDGRVVPMFVAWTHPFAPLSGLLLDRDKALDAVPALMAALRALPGSPRAALFPLLPETSVAARLIALDVASRGHSVTRLNVHARAALMREQDEAFSMVSTRKRKELRRQRRRLGELGSLEHDIALDPHDVRAAVAAFLELEQRGWKGRAGEASVSDPATVRFMSTAVGALAEEGKARVDRLILNKRTIAAAITLYSGDYAWFWKVAYDEEFARYSPGVQVSIDLTEALEADRRVALVDSCAVADHPMIDHLWSGRIPMADWLVPLNGIASFTAASVAERTRRAAISPLKKLRDRFRR
jgi:CelD/BcsL family acetyltransferase involved in cellulose biosynthesis